MKCMILAGGRGERLWPLSRKNYPKQFIQIQRNHSLFQETVARNLPYCDEFIIVTSYEYRYIIDSQMSAFQGVTYRCVYEEIPRKTASAVALSCMELQPSDMIYVVASDHIIKPDEKVKDGYNYTEAILRAKELAGQGSMVCFGMLPDTVNPRFGWIQRDDENVLRFVEKPGMRLLEEISKRDDYLQNAGLLLFENGVFLKELKLHAQDFYEKCHKAYKKRKIEGNKTTYSKEVLEHVDPEFLEPILLERTKNLKVVTCGFDWSDVGSLEDLSNTEYTDDGLCIKYKAERTHVINNTDDQVVVINDADDLMVVNTPDAIYIGKYGESDKLKDILKDNDSLRPYSDKGSIYYRSWGYYQQLFEEKEYRIRRVVIYPGKTIYAHSHKHRTENWAITAGKVLVSISGDEKIYEQSENVNIPIDTVHQISNIGIENAVFVETACGDIIHEEDIISANASDLNEASLGIENEPFVKLVPAYKDYLWGGRKLKEKFSKECEYDTVAESWELSAHPDGQSVVATGKHAGLYFGEYIDRIGHQNLGWKSQSVSQFPLLVKLIDAHDNLSVQVHPDDDYALANEISYGKNEMWYVLDTEPDSKLYVGFNRDVSREEVLERLDNNTILEVLNEVKTKPGDVFFISAGTVHAIGAGNLICEIQQSSNCTYRLYDYDRVDKYGNKRPLHIEKALDVLDYKKYSPQEFEKEELLEGTTLSRCKYFETTVYEIEDSLVLKTDENSFLSIICIDGGGEISSNGEMAEIKSGDSFFARARNGEINLSGKMKIVVSMV